MPQNEYQTDFYSWTEHQSELLKSHQFETLDIENIIEELQTMGRSEKRELQSRLTILLLHLLKWQYQSVRRGRSWQLTIDEQRLQFCQVLNDNPGLKSKLDEIIINAYRLAVIRTAKATAIETTQFPNTCPWTLEQITNDNYYPD